jgi:DNA-binding GntR family transcriptional regulator
MGEMMSSGWVQDLAEDKSLLDRTSTAERVADVLRRRIIDGMLPPGTRLSEESVGGALAVSRNTLREAFRLLAHERLLVHEFHRGVFVRELSAQDVVDLYEVRQMLETSAVRRAGTASPEAVRAVASAVADGERAAGQQRWLDVGTANMRFHEAIVALAGSRRADEIMRQLLAELRLCFHVMSPLRDFHEPYIEDNRGIADLLQAGCLDRAEQRLHDYLITARQQLVRAYEGL